MCRFVQTSPGVFEVSDESDRRYVITEEDYILNKVSRNGYVIISDLPPDQAFGSNFRNTRHTYFKLLRYFIPDYLGDTSYRPCFTLILQIYAPIEKPYDLTPYSYSLISHIALPEIHLSTLTPRQQDEVRTNRETLVLNVDREIDIHFVHERGSFFVWDLIRHSGDRFYFEHRFVPLGFMGMEPVSTVLPYENGTLPDKIGFTLLIKRYQQKSRVPQSNNSIAGFFNCSKLFSHQQIAQRTTGARGVGTVRVTEITKREIVIEENETSCKFYFVEKFRSDETLENADILAILELTYFHSQFKGGYYYHCDVSNPLLPILYLQVSGDSSRYNVNIKFTYNGALSFWEIITGSENIMERLNSRDGFLSKFDVRINANISVFNLQRQFQNFNRGSSTDYLALNQSIEQYRRRYAIESTFEELREGYLSNVLLVAGFVPVLSDIIDIAEFVKYMLTGRDLTGRQVTPVEALFIVGSLIPAVSSLSRRVAGLRHSAETARLAALLESSELSTEVIRMHLRTIDRFRRTMEVLESLNSHSSGLLMVGMFSNLVLNLGEEINP